MKGRKISQVLTQLVDGIIQHLTFLVFVVTILFLILFLIIFWIIFNPKYKNAIKNYNESSYTYLYELSDQIVTSSGINISVIPDNVRYSLSNEDGEIKLNCVQNVDELFAPSPYIVIKIQKDPCRIISSKLNITSKEEYNRTCFIAFAEHIVFGSLISTCWSVVSLLFLLFLITIFNPKLS